MAASVKLQQPRRQRGAPSSACKGRGSRLAPGRLAENLLDHTSRHKPHQTIDFDRSSDGVLLGFELTRRDRVRHPRPRPDDLCPIPSPESRIKVFATTGRGP
jgi:hypothetical protein